MTHRRWLVILCVHHHLDGWGTSKDGLAYQRQYLEEKEGDGTST